MLRQRDAAVALPGKQWPNIEKSAALE